MSIPRKKIQRESILVPHHMHLFPISTVLVYIGNELLYVLEHVDEWTCSLRRDIESCREGIKQREESLSEEERDLLEREYQENVDWANCIQCLEEDGQDILEQIGRLIELIGERQSRHYNHCRVCNRSASAPDTPDKPTQVSTLIH
jgi:hypothetical protein